MALAPTNFDIVDSALYTDRLGYLQEQSLAIENIGSYSRCEKERVEQAVAFKECKGIVLVAQTIKDKIASEAKEMGILFDQLARIIGYVGMCFVTIGILFKSPVLLIGLSLTTFSFMSNVISTLRRIYVKSIQPSFGELKRMEGTLKDKIQVVQLGLKQLKAKVQVLKATPSVRNGALKEDVAALAKKIQQTVEEVKQLVDMIHENTIFPKTRSKVLWQERMLLSDVARTVRACNQNSYFLSPSNLVSMLPSPSYIWGRFAR